jgi:hypothetical protein
MENIGGSNLADSHYSSKELMDLIGGQDWLYQLTELLSPGGNTADNTS